MQFYVVKAGLKLLRILLSQLQSSGFTDVHHFAWLYFVLKCAYGVRAEGIWVLPICGNV